MAPSYPPYALHFADSFLEDLKSLLPDDRTVVLTRLTAALEVDPLKYAKALGTISDVEIFLTKTREWYQDHDFPAMYMTFSITKPPPDGIVSMRRVKSEADVRAGV